MVLAAGLGTRLQPFTQITAKPLLPIMGVPMIQFVFDALKEADIEKVVINVHSHATASTEAIRFLDGPKEKIISDESSLLLGSAGGIVKALDHFEDKPFFLLNADTIFRVNLKDLAAVHQRLKHEFGVQVTLAVLARSPGEGRYRSIGLDPKRNLIRSIGEPLKGVPFFSGVAVIEPSALKSFESGKPADFLKEVLMPAVLKGRAGAYWIDNTAEMTPTSWFDIGSPELWFNTHRQFMSLYEAEELPSLWRKRIEKHSRRIGANAWVSNRSSIQQIPSRWSAPFYWDPSNSIEQSSSPPKTLGPNAFLYGSTPDDLLSSDEIKSGIGYAKIWKAF